jgi:TonB family protein
LSSDGDKFEIRRTPGNSETSVSLIERAKQGNTNGEYHDGHISFGPSGTTNADITVRVGVLHRRDVRRVDATTYDQSILIKFATANAVELQHQKLGTIRIPIPSSAAAIHAVRECEDRKMREWGIDPVQWRGPKSPPIPMEHWSKWLNDFDYPMEAISFSVEGGVIARLDVAADGTVSNCKVMNPGKYKGFENSACYALKKRARFNPALDAIGNPVASVYVVDVEFRTG